MISRLVLFCLFLSLPLSAAVLDTASTYRFCEGVEYYGTSAYGTTEVATLFDHSVDYSFWKTQLAHVRDVNPSDDSMTCRTLIRFVGLDSIPDWRGLYAGIASAVCSVHVASGPGGYKGEWAGTVRLNMRRVTEDWSVSVRSSDPLIHYGASGTPTWLKADSLGPSSRSSWTNAGCDTPTSASPTIFAYVDLDADSNYWATFTMPTSEIAYAIANPGTSWVISSDEDSSSLSGLQYERTFWSDQADDTLRPILRVNFADPGYTIIDGLEDIPYTTTAAGDTIIVVTDSLIADASGPAITVSHDHCYIDLNGNTLFVGQVAASGFNRGIYINADTCTVRNGTLEQHSTSTNDSLIVVDIGSDVRHIYLDSVNVHARGYGSGGVKAEGASEVRLYGGNHTSYVSDFESRENQWESPILLRDETIPSRTAPQQFRYWVAHVTIDSCPHAGIVMNGGTLWCDSNFVRVDARNHWTYPSGDNMRGTANGYGIAIDRIGADCRVYGNTIRSGVNHRGGRGIALDGQASWTSHHYIEVAYNDDSVHAGPDAAYGMKYQGVGLRVRDTGTDSLYFHHNTIIVSCDTALATEHTGTKAFAVWLTNSGDFWRFEYNTIRAIGIPGLYGQRMSNADCGPYVDQCGSVARAVIFDQLTPIDSTRWRYNRIESNVAPISYGEVNTSTIAGENNYFTGDTINRITPDYGDEWGNDGSIVMSLASGDCENNYMTDVVFGVIRLSIGMALVRVE